ncbi:VCBS repeat-containing protein [candidate division KSB1 bacterium]|nr:VCBS repeat-containing protein [candidate division KSB1 bacterium]
MREVASIPDVNGDGLADCLAGSDDDNVYCISGDPAQVGAEIWSYYTGGSVYGVAAIPDVNGDGIQDCLAATANSTAYCISGASSGTGTVLWSHPDDYGYWDIVAVPDVNSDGYYDVFAGSMSNKVYCLSGKASISGSRELWSYAASGDIWVVSIIEDVNADGIYDCLAGTGDDRVLCLSGKDGTFLWDFSATYDVRCVTSIGDVNNDGKSDCVAGSSDHYAYCLSGSNGSKLWERNFGTGADVWAVAAIPDINSDGKPDCVVGTLNNEVVTISGASSGIGTVLWSQSTGGDVRTVAAASDLNENGIVDILSGSSDSYIRAYEGNSLVVAVELVSFSAFRVDNNIHLEWNTASELNNYGFKIIKSNDGINFEEIGFVHGHGTTSTPNSYSFVDEDGGSEILFYQLNQIDFDGTQTKSEIIKIDVAVPSDFTVLKNYPNPFNANTKIQFTVPSKESVQVSVINISGEIVRILLNKLVPAGAHQVFWNGKNDFGSEVASGTYICSVKWGNSIKTFPMTYLK